MQHSFTLAVPALILFPFTSQHGPLVLHSHWIKWSGLEHDAEAGHPLIHCNVFARTQRTVWYRHGGHYSRHKASENCQPRLRKAHSKRRTSCIYRALICASCLTLQHSKHWEKSRCLRRKVPLSISLLKKAAAFWYMVRICYGHELTSASSMCSNGSGRSWTGAECLFLSKDKETFAKSSPFFSHFLGSCVVRALSKTQAYRQLSSLQCYTCTLGRGSTAGVLRRRIDRGPLSVRIGQQG